jgi:2-succinyl-5-enolpyruvyl-6-hydroxy-3-cyclohexene-1-carboxylate synthase
MTDIRHQNAVRADLIVDALVQHGVGIVFVCPGSRSTPLVMALARKQMRTHVVLDERTAAYAAVGAARMGMLAAVCTTSGTAVANLLPALCEADLDELGIVALTADRPRSAIDSGANQTLNQGPLLAGAVRHVLDLDAPGEDKRDGNETAKLLHDALDHLRGHGRGPVHINARFSKPLEPADDYESDESPPNDVAVIDVATPLPSSWLAAFAAARAGIVVCGALPWAARLPAQQLITTLGWPALVDISSGVSTHIQVSASLLRSPAVREQLRPDVVLWLGGTTIEDAASSWARNTGAQLLQLRTGARVRDPERMFHHSLVRDPAQLADGILAAPSSSLHVIVRKLATLDQSTHHHNAMTTLTEPALAHAVASSVGVGEVLLLGNSMPVRDVGRFSDITPGAIVIGNRGLSGIDGTFGTALGAALASAQPITVFVGDLTTLHDLTGLLALTGAADVVAGEVLEEGGKGNPRVRVVAENNDGGGIFSFLPICMHQRNANVFERSFGTPHGKQLAPIAAALGAKSCRIHDLVTLQQQLSAPIDGIEFIEVCTDRNTNVAVHAALDEAREQSLSTPPQLVLLHGALGSAEDWQALRQRLPAALAIELPGHGENFRVGPGGDANAIIDDIIKTIESLAVSEVVLVGYSLGARLALQIALQRPSWLGGLVLESVHPGLERDDDREARKRQDDDFAVALRADPHAAVSSFYQRPVFASLRRRNDFNRLVDVRAARAARQPHALAMTWKSASLGRQPSLWSLLPSIDVPLLVITGGDDTSYVAHGARIATLVPRSEHVVVPGAGHNVHLEHADAYVAALTNWLSRRSRP